MRKQGQFIAYKANLGLSLSLLLINQLAAQASTTSDKTTSDKTEWLTSSLNQVKKSHSDSSTVTLKALSAHEDKREKAITFSYLDNPSHTIKMRPFMPNRKLPSRQDLQLALIEQRAKLAEEANARLSGQVSTFVVGAENNNQAASEQSHWVSPRNNLQQNRNYISRNYIKQPQARSSQSNFSYIKQAEQRLLSTTMQQTNESVSLPIVSGINSANTLSSLTPMAMPIQSLPLQSSEPQMPAPIMETYSSNFNSPPTSPTLPNTNLENNQTTVSGFGSAGPPPFPLNLVPEATLKQLIRSLASSRGVHAGNAPRAAFGSWHNNASYNNLSYGGFQTHMGHRYIQTSNIAFYRISALPAVTGSPIRSKICHQKAQNISNPQDTAARNRMLLESQVRVAVYPAYTTQSLRPWNFAQ